MVTEIQKSKLAGLLSNIKSKDGKNNLLDHINKMYIIKNQLKIKNSSLKHMKK